MDQESEPPFSQSNSHGGTTAGAPTNNEQLITESFNRMSLGTPTATPLPESSPAASPDRTPKALRNGVLSGARPPLSPSRRISSSSPLNPERRSSTPLLQSKRSTSSLKSANSPSQPSLARKPSVGRLPSYTNVTQRRPSMSGSIQEERPMFTAASVSQDHFKKELEIHSSGNLPAETLVVIHDSCYGHRYSRPRTSKSQLNTIVERPERLHASILGISTAYVRLSGRHSDGEYPLRLDLDLKTVPPPPFHIKKTSRTLALNSPAVVQVHGQKWMEELQVMCESAESKLALNGKELARPDGYGQEPNGSQDSHLHEGDLYLCKDSLDAFEGCLGGVCEGIDSVFGAGPAKRAFVCIRPPGHHCSSSYPSGFCWLNNVHVGIAHAAMTHGLTHAAIIDFDLHHGDGSQSIAWNHNRRAASMAKNAAHHKKTPIGYFSVHDINSYPCEMGDEDKVLNASLCIENAHGQSIWNVHLEPWKTMEEFWQLYHLRYRILLEKARKFLSYHTSRLKASVNGPRPKAAIFISAGFDACEWEGAGMQRHKVNVPATFYAKFTSDIVSMAEEEGLGVDGRVISVLEGGYSDRALTSGTLSHVCGLCPDMRLTRKGVMDLPADGLAASLSNSNIASNIERSEKSTSTSYNAEWWAEHHLEALESMTRPVSIPTAVKKPKDKAPGNYSSPTQASTAKMIDPSMARRYSSLSSVDIARLPTEPESPQPLPEVDWVTASYELSRLLVPTNRQTLSCRHEELSAELNRAKRERQSMVPPPSSGAAAEGRMQLRERRPRPAIAEEELTKGLTRANRRRTIAAVGELPDPDLQDPIDTSRNSEKTHARSSSRRLSAASSVLSGFSNLNLDDHLDSSKENSTKSASATRSSRTPSVLSEKEPKPPLVKKTRAPATNKPSALKSSTVKGSPKKTTTGPAVPKTSSNKQVQSSNNDTTSSGGTNGLEKSHISEPTAPRDVDGLSKGMKKMSIKLKVPSPEENAAREKKSAEDKQRKNVAEKPKKPRAPKKPIVPKLTKPVATEAESSADASTAQKPPNNLTDGDRLPVQQHSAIAVVPASSDISTAAVKDESKTIQAEKTSSNDQVFPNSAPTTGSIGTPSLAPKIAQPGVLEVTDDCPTYKQQDWAAEQSAPRHDAEIASSRAEQPTQPQDNLSNPRTPPAISPPNSARKTRADLPIFTSTSPIPFARSSTAGTSGPTSVAISTNGQAAKDMAATYDTENTTDSTSDHLGTSQNQASAEHQLNAKQASEADFSVWEVPETPRR